MWEPYQIINSLDAFNTYETMWAEGTKTKNDRITNDAISYEQSNKKALKLRDIWPKYSHVKLLVHGKYNSPTWTFDDMSNSKRADSENLQQFMDYEVINVSVFSKPRSSNVTDIKIEVIKPGYHIGDPIVGW